MARIKSFNLRRGTSIKNYQIRDCLGRGWEGEVYHVREESSQAERVMKLLDPAEYRSKQISLYGQTLEAISQVLGVIRFYHTGYWEPRDCYFLVMQYVGGTPLDQCVPNGPIGLFRALRIVRELLQIVQGCHALGYRVGDIHEENVVLGPDDWPFIIDFDLGGRLDKEAVIHDIIAACKLLYYLTKGDVLPADLKEILPKRVDALERRYKSVESVIAALDNLVGIRQRTLT